MEKQLQSMYIGEEGALRSISYSMEILLPQIADFMRKKRKSMLTIEEAHQCVSKNRRLLQRKYFQFAYPMYLGKTRAMYANTKDVSEWYDYIIRELLIDKANVLKENRK